MKESDVERRLVWWAIKLGGKAYKFRSPSNRGVADRVVCLPNETWFIELKKPGGRLSPLQQIFRGEMLAYQQRYALLESMDDVDAWGKTQAARLSGRSG